MSIIALIIKSMEGPHKCITRKCVRVFSYPDPCFWKPVAYNAPVVCVCVEVDVSDVLRWTRVLVPVCSEKATNGSLLLGCSLAESSRDVNTYRLLNSL